MKYKAALNELVELLRKYAGETGVSESNTEVLQRLLAELELSRLNK